MQRYSEYKDSGVQWIGEIPGHWKMTRNKSFLSLTDEKVGERKDITLLSLTKQGVIVRDLSEGKGKFPKDFESYLVVRPNNLVFCLFDVDETPRTVGLVHNYGMLTGAYTNFEVDESICLPEFAQYFYIQIDDVKGLRPYYTGLRKVVKTNTFLQIRLPLPPLPEQHSIVSYLDSKCAKLDKMLENKEKQIALLAEMKQRIIADAVTRGLDPEVKMKKTNIPWIKEIPEHWEMSKVSSHFRQRNEKVSDKDYPALSVSKMGVTPQLDNVALSNADGNSRKLVKIGDYAVNSRSDRKGSCGVSKYEGSVSLITIVLEPFNINGNYVHYLFRSTPWVEEFYRNGRGIVADLWTTNYQMMKGMYFPVPPLSEQLSIVSHLDARCSKIDALIAKLHEELSSLKEYKQRLISDVVTGQIKVSIRKSPIDMESLF